MALFLVSDTHFGHANIIGYCDRPFTSVEEMNESLIKNWNSVVKPEDTVIHVGDFAFLPIEKAKKVCHKLNGKKILVRGNHDGSVEKMLEIGFTFVVESMTFNWMGRKLLFTHYPIEPEKARLDILTEIGAFAHIHGHQHNGTPLVSGKSAYNVSVENIGYTPISFEQLFKSK